MQRTARYYTLGGGSAAPRDVWFVLHGYGQLAGDFIRYFSDLAADDSLVVAPEAMNRFYLVTTETSAPARDRPVGATWMTREDRDSEIADYVEYLDALYDEVRGRGRARRRARSTSSGFRRARRRRRGGSPTAARRRRDWCSGAGSCRRRPILSRGQAAFAARVSRS